MTLLTEAEYLQRRLNALRKKMSLLTYGARHDKTKRNKINAVSRETNMVLNKLRQALNKNRTIIHHNMANVRYPNFGNRNWIQKNREASRLQSVLTRAQNMREQALRRRAMNVIKRYWYMPPPPPRSVGRGYLRVASLYPKSKNIGTQTNHK